MVGALGLLAGCSSLAPATSRETLARLSGAWVLDPGQSDDAGAKIAAALPRARPDPGREGHARDGGGSPPAGAAGPPHGRDVAPPAEGRHGRRQDEQAEVRREMESRLTPFSRLDVLADPGHFVVVGGDASSRSFEPGETFVRADEFGASEVESGWQGQVYVIHEKPLDGQGDFTETFEVDAAGQLVCTRRINIPRGGKATVRSVYLRLPGTAMSVGAF